MFWPRKCVFFCFQKSCFEHFAFFFVFFNVLERSVKSRKQLWSSLECSVYSNDSFCVLKTFVGIFLAERCPLFTALVVFCCVLSFGSWLNAVDGVDGVVADLKSTFHISPDSRFQLERLVRWDGVFVEKSMKQSVCENKHKTLFWKKRKSWFVSFWFAFKEKRPFDGIISWSFSGRNSDGSTVWSRGVLRSYVWHLLLELQALALESSWRKLRVFLIPKIRKKTQKTWENTQKTSFKTFLPRHCILSSREFDPESSADVGEAQLLKAVSQHLDTVNHHGSIMDHRPSTVCFLLRSCRMPVEPCVLGCIQLSHKKHALESTDEGFILAAVFFLYICGPSFSKVQGEDPPVHPGYKKDGEGQLESPQFSVNIGLRGVEAIAQSSLRCCSRCIEMWQFLLAEGRCMLMWYVLYSFYDMIRRMDKEMLFLYIHTK